MSCKFHINIASVHATGLAIACGNGKALESSVKSARQNGDSVLHEKDGRFVQYGCGWACPPNSWRNFDASPTLRFERIPLVGKLYTKNASRFPDYVEYGDIVEGLPVGSRSCIAVYCSHVLEHLSLQDFRKALENTRAILRDGAIFRLVLPDLEYAVKKYCTDSSSDAAVRFLSETALGRERRSRGLKELASEWLGNSQHLWMWDYKSIRAELENAGFRDIRRAQFGDSMEPMFGEVEELDRWEDCLGVECRA